MSFIPLDRSGGEVLSSRPREELLAQIFDLRAAGDHAANASPHRLFEPGGTRTIICAARRSFSGEQQHENRSGRATQQTTLSAVVAFNGAGQTGRRRKESNPPGPVKGRTGFEGPGLRFFCVWRDGANRVCARQRRCSIRFGLVGWRSSG